jgi:ubiquinone/menaquinone biosynthesis C-methylase UbiE
MAQEYVHGYAQSEQERLLAQAAHWRDDLILEGTALLPGTRLLEVGCGVGAVLGILGDAFPDVTLAGVDLEARQIEMARDHLREQGIAADVRCADGLSLPYDDGSFDHVWMMWFLEHVADAVGALREARRVLVTGGELTAIEVDYNTTWASPTSDGIETLVQAIARTMEANGHSDAGTRLEAWLGKAGFRSIDPGERRLCFSGPDLARQLPYVIAVVESTLADLAAASEATEAALRKGVTDLRRLAATPGAAFGFVAHKARAVR